MIELNKYGMMYSLYWDSFRDIYDVKSLDYVYMFRDNNILKDDFICISRKKLLKELNKDGLFL